MRPQRCTDHQELRRFGLEQPVSQVGNLPGVDGQQGEPRMKDPTALRPGPGPRKFGGQQRVDPAAVGRQPGDDRGDLARARIHQTIV